MKFLTATALSFAYAAAQSSSATSAATAAAAGVVHTVTVGGMMPAAAGQSAAPALVFSPDHVFATPGDVVRFMFMQKNHSVAQSTFAEPCIAIDGGFQSGFMPNPSGDTPAPVFEFAVPDSTKPIWMFCQQEGHCGKGMVFAVNPSNATGSASDKNMDNYKQLAMSKFGAGSTSAGVSAAGQMAANNASETASAPVAVASVASGSGKGSGQEFACQCLCGVNAWPTSVGTGQFGGFLGEMPSGPTSVSAAGAAAPTGMAPYKRALPAAWPHVKRF